MTVQDFEMSQDAPILDAVFRDVDALCATVRSWDLDFRPLRVRGEPTQVARITQHHCGGLELAYARFNLCIEQLGEPPAGMVTFAVLGEQMRRLWWRGHDVDAGTVLVFCPGVELHSVSGPDFEVITISLPVESIVQVSNQYGLPLVALERGLETFRPAAGELAALRQRLRQFREGSETPDSIGRLHDARIVGEGLVLGWLRACLSSQAGRRAGPSSRARDRAMRTSLALIEQADLNELTPAMLCETCGVGERTLQYAFRERFGLTPAAFLKARRLAMVRSALQQLETKEASIGDLAARHGFWHPGQFASDYRRAFRETPSETVKRTLPRA
jgi:AraC family ethanolamine operon transcriptional activator